MASQIQAQTQTQIPPWRWISVEKFDETMLRNNEYYVTGIYEVVLNCASYPCILGVGSVIKPIKKFVNKDELIELAKQLDEWEALHVIESIDEKHIEIGCHDYIDLAIHKIIVAKIHSMLVVSKYVTYRRVIESIDPIWCP